jgi:hypothetical protein
VEERVEWSGVDEWIDDEKRRRKTPLAFVFILFDRTSQLV